MIHWLLKTQWGWCGLIIENNAIKNLVLPAPNTPAVPLQRDTAGYRCPYPAEAGRAVYKSLILQRINPHKKHPVNMIINRNPEIIGISLRLNKKISADTTYGETKLALALWADLNKYFNGEKVDFNYKISLRDYTNFDRSVYRALKTVPYGRIRTYKWIAERIGSPRASRAVGNALAKNPLPLIIPCHRITKSDGSLGNFSAIGGVGLKEKLLRLERALKGK